MIRRLERAPLFICDNGACYCRDHLGYTARMTGRDISGQAIMEISVDLAVVEGISCEVCNPIGGTS